ncbi:extensin family protein [Bradyrhizobium sp.]|uniref:extensin family protein n=1 Tax=Bradyrhizobium sp. TaxID=376 RepID=UPI002D48E038|nr:extensin family protein [Bradyrhizobium sp.]HZR72029.1 extensin family protein [Bradyrhizobium sp.]
MVTAAALLFAGYGPTHTAAARALSAKARVTARVPLPRPRPAEAPSAKAEPSTAPDEKNTEKAEPPPPSACRLALTDQVAIAPSIPDIHGPGGCGGEDLVRLEAVVLPDQHHVALKPAAILRCKMASAVADWVRTDVAALAKSMGSVVTDLDNFDSFECRSRNRIAGAMLSEHGRANALDVRSFKFADGRTISLTDRNVARDVRESVLHSVCTRFTTVLGPGSDGYHEDHIHLDLMERHNNYRICQWYVWDPLPAVAPMLPEPRPEGAPPREVTDEPAGDKPAPDQTAQKPPADHPPAKKRR